MGSADDRRRLSLMVDYVFGRGASASLPRAGVRFRYSRRSGRVKLITLNGKTFATVRPNGSMALSVDGAALLANGRRFGANYVEVVDDAAMFVKGGKSVFCKFVKSAGRNVLPEGEVVIVGRRGLVLGVGTAVLNGAHMRQFKSGVAVKVRAGIVR